MDLRVLHYFLTVAREQSFTKAAKQLHITQPTLSRQLAALEEELGTKLLDRGGHKIILTGEGLLLKRRAPEIIDLENKIIDEFKGNEDFDHIRIRESDHWVVSMKPDDPLAQKDYITKEDLLELPLIVPERLGVQSELANWLGADFHKIKIAFTSNFSTNAGIMALNGLGYPVSIEAAIQSWREDLLVQKRLYPEITANTVIAWRRNLPRAYAVQKFIEEIHAFKA